MSGRVVNWDAYTTGLFAALQNFKGKILSTEQLKNVRTENASILADDVTFRSVPADNLSSIVIYDGATGSTFAVVDVSGQSCGGDVTIQWDDRGIVFNDSLTGNLPSTWEPVSIH